MVRTADRFPGEREDEGMILDEVATHPTVNGELRYVVGEGFRFYDQGKVLRLIRPATQMGQVLYSLDGLTFTSALPITSSRGWLRKSSGELIVKVPT